MFIYPLLFDDTNCQPSLDQLRSWLKRWGFKKAILKEGESSAPSDRQGVSQPRPRKRRRTRSRSPGRLRRSPSLDQSLLFDDRQDTFDEQNAFDDGQSTPSIEMRVCGQVVAAKGRYDAYQNCFQDSETYRGTDYIRKHDGPLKGMLVNGGALLNIKNRDYIEYRVLYEIL
jgi:hypothetical protein